MKQLALCKRLPNNRFNRSVERQTADRGRRCNGVQLTKQP